MSRFDKVAEIWDANQRILQTAEKIYKAIAESLCLCDDKNVADIGTGTGLLLIHIQPFVKEITGFDNSEGMLAELDKKAEKANLKNVKTKLFDADKDKMPENYFDLVVSSMTFHHIKNIENYLKNIYNSLTERGEICIADLETEDGMFHSEPNEDIRHLGFDKKEFNDMMINAGFKETSVITLFSIDKEGKKYPVFLAYGKK